MTRLLDRIRRAVGSLAGGVWGGAGSARPGQVHLGLPVRWCQVRLHGCSFRADRTMPAVGGDVGRGGVGSGSLAICGSCYRRLRANPSLWQTINRTPSDTRAAIARRRAGRVEPDVEPRSSDCRGDPIHQFL